MSLKACTRECRACRRAAWRSTIPASGPRAPAPRAGAARPSRCRPEARPVRRSARGRWTRAAPRRRSLRSRSERVDHHQQVERLDRLQGLGLVGQRHHQVGRVHEPALDRIGLAGERGLANAGGDGLVGERVLFAAGIVHERLGALRVARQRVGRRSSCRPAQYRPPLRPQLPSSALSSAMARLRCVSSPYQLTRRPGWMRAPAGARRSRARRRR